MAGYTTELSAPPELRMLSADELIRLYSQCGDPLIERFCYAIAHEFDPDAVEDAEGRADEAEQRNEELETENASLWAKLEKYQKQVADLERQIRNLGGVPA